MTPPAITTTPATQAQRSLLGRLAVPTWERGNVELGVELAAAVHEPGLTSERVEQLLAEVSASRRRAS